MVSDVPGPRSIDPELIDPVLDMARRYHQEVGYETVPDVMGGLAVLATAEVSISTKEIHLPLPCLSTGRQPYDVSFKVNMPLSAEDQKDWKLEVLYCGKDTSGRDLSTRYHMLVTGDNKILTTVNSESPKGYLDQESMPILAGIIEQIYSKAKQIQADNTAIPLQRSNPSQMTVDQVSGAQHSG